MAFPDNDLQVKVYAYLGADPTADPSNWPAPVDLTSRLLDRDISLSLGRSPGQRTAAAGQCTLWLDNDDGALTPLLPTSPYYPHWDLGVPIAVDVDGVGPNPPYGLFRGYAASIEAEIVPLVGGGSTSAVKVTLGGVLRRLGQGAEPKSALRRTVTGRHITPPVAYWPMEAGSDASLLASPIDGCPSLTLPANDHLNSGGYDGIPGSLAVPVWESYREDGLSGYVIPPPAQPSGIMPTMGQGTIVIGLVFAGALETPTGSTLLEVDLVDGDHGKLRIGAYASTINGVLSTSYGVEASLIDEVTPSLEEVGYDSPGDSGPQPFDGRPHSIWLVLQQVGGDVDMTLLVDGQQYTNTATGVTLGTPDLDTLRVGGSLTAISLGGGEDVGDGSGFAVAVAHVGIWDSEPSIDYYAAMRGYAGETAMVRVARVCAEEGIPHTAWSPAPTDDIRLGPQPIGTVLDVLRDAELAGHGILHELTSTWGLGYRPLQARYNLSPAMTIDLATYRVTGSTGRDTLKPVWNDQRIRNEWTVSRPGGSSVTVRDATHQAKRGRYTDSATVNVETDDGLLHEAGWRLHETIYDGLRYAAMPIDLGANPSPIGDWLALRPGDRIDRTGHPSQHPSGTASVILEGFSATLRRRGWTVNAVVEPYAPWDVGVLGDWPHDPNAPSGRLAGDEACAIRADIADSDTEIDFDPNLYRWATLWVHDTFDRTESGQWGTPDVGPTWVTVDTVGGTLGVSGGYGIVTMTATSEDRVLRVGSLSLRDAQVHLREVHPASTPTGDQIHVRLEFRGANVFVLLTWNPDGTAEIQCDGVSDGLPSGGPVGVPGVSASEPVDMLVSLAGQHLSIWAAPTSTGIDLASAPLLEIRVGLFAAGNIDLSVESDASLGVPLAMRFGGIDVTSPGTFADDFPVPVMLTRSPSAPTSGGELVQATRITTTEAAYVAAGAPDHDDNVAVTPSDYAGGAVGDWVVVVAGERDSGASLSISDDNYTYTLLGRQSGLYVWAAVRTGDTPAPTVTPSGGGSGDTVSAAVIGLRDMPITLSLDHYVLDSAGQTNSSSQNIAYPGLTEGIHWGRVILLVARKSDDWTGVAPPSGFAEAVDTSTTSGDDQGLYVAYRIDSEPSKVDPGSLAVTGGASAVSDALVLALAGGYQTMTVTRAVNGVVKAHQARARLAADDPLVLAL